MSAQDLDDVQRLPQLRRLIQGKAALKAWYEGVYARWAGALAAVPGEGLAVELGAGAGFAKDRIPGLWTTDTLPYEGLDQVADAQAMPWGGGEIRAIFALNVFHHLPDVSRFLGEVERVLRPGGILLLTDQHPGPVAAPILRHAHHEPFDPRAAQWQAPVNGALAGANGALAWIVFRRDLELFRQRHPSLELLEYRTFAPLQYWMAGGLKAWNAAPGPLAALVRGFDALLLKLWPDCGSFVHVLVKKRGAP